MLRIQLTRVSTVRTSPRRRRHRWAPLMGVALAVASVTPAAAAGSGTVPGSVTVEQSVACLLVEGSYDFGSQPLAAANGAPDPHSSSTTAGITSCGTDTQDVLVHGSNAIGDAVPAATWQLSAGAVSGSCGVDTFGIGVTMADVANSPTVPVSLLDSSFGSFSPGLQFNTGANIYMPCSGSSGAGETMTFSVVYTAIVTEGPQGPFEVEPNDTAANATILNVGVNTVTSIYGAISPIGDLDTYQVSLPAGTIAIETFDGSGNPTCTGLDTFVQLIDATNTLVAQDDDSGIGFCSLLSAPVAGVYQIVVTDFGSNNVIPGYRLQISVS